MTTTAQRGQALLAVLLLALVLGAGGLLGSGALRARTEAHAHARSVAALAEARRALIGYAVSYAERHPGAGYGFLPCPDGGNDGSTDLGACGARDSAALGRLPWRTLALPELRDGWGECLWYAVAGSVKHNPKPLALDWDSPGQFEILAADGERIVLPSPDGRAVAVIFAPGPAHAGQRRPHGHPGSCSGSDSIVADLPHYLDHAYPRSSPGPLPITQNPLQAGDLARPNDLVVWIGADEIFAALRRRSDFAAYLDGLLARAADALQMRLTDAARADWLAAHARPAGAVHTAALPTADELGLPAGERAEIDQWRKQMRFAACAADEACITVLRDVGSERCSAVLGFSGERVPAGPNAQRRDTPAERADPAQYFEGRNASGFALGEPFFEGARTRASDRPDQPDPEDLILCLP